MTSEEFKFIEINEEDIENVFREINVNASPGEDKIPPKLVKLARRYLVKPLKEAINVAFYIVCFLITLNIFFSFLFFSIWFG